MNVTHQMAEDASKELLIHTFFLQGLTEQVVQEAYRARARETHPDTEGGSAEAFVAVDRAKHVLIKWLAKSKPYEPAHGGGKCPRCEGRGYIMSQRAFRAMRVQCAKCKGTGELGVEGEKGDFR